MNRLVLPVLAIALSLPAAAQDEGRVLKQYRPVNLPARTLVDATQRLFAGEKDVRREVFNVGELVFVYASPEEVARTIEALEAFDQETETGTVLRVYDLRHVDADQALVALQPLRRSVIADREGGAEVPNVGVVPGQNRLVVRETPANQKTVAAVLEAIDVAVAPSPDVLLTLWIVRATASAGASDERIPEALRTELPRLLPYPRFEVLGVALLRTQVGDESASLEMDLEKGGLAQVELRVGPYDASRQVLELAGCKFGCRILEAEAQREVEFRTTAATLREGEFTVLGAVGQEPVLLVVQPRIESGR